MLYFKQYYWGKRFHDILQGTGMPVPYGNIIGKAKTMIGYLEKRHNSLLYKILSAFIAFTFVLMSVLPPGYAQVVSSHGWTLQLPAPGAMVAPSAAFTPALINGITIHPENPLEFDFIVGTGDDKLEGKAFEDGRLTTNPGGIDMNAIALDRRGAGVDIQFDPAELQEIIDLGIDGFAPVIINITPLPGVLPLLGLDPANREEGLEVSSLN